MYHGRVSYPKALTGKSWQVTCMRPCFFPWTRKWFISTRIDTKFCTIQEYGFGFLTCLIYWFPLDLPGALFIVMEFPTILFLTNKLLSGILRYALTGIWRRESWRSRSLRWAGKDSWCGRKILSPGVKECECVSDFYNFLSL